jgi:hypothetical protein
MTARAVKGRRRGSGCLLLRVDSTGRRSWYGLWRTGGRSVKRKLGGHVDDWPAGLTRLQAEDRLARLMGRTPPSRTAPGNLSACYSKVRLAAEEVDRTIATTEPRRRAMLREAIVALYEAEDRIVEALGTG